MNSEDLEKFKKHLDNEVRQLARDPVVQNSNAIWVMECARVLGRQFAFLSVGDSYFICFSGESIYELHYAIEQLSKQKDFTYSVGEAIRACRNEWCAAARKCEAIIQVFENRAKDEQKLLEARLQLEADYRYNNNRRY